MALSFTAQAADDFAQSGGFSSSCFSYPAVAMTPYDESTSKYHSTHSRVYHKGRNRGSILLYGPARSGTASGDGVLFEASFIDPDGAGTRSQVTAELRFVGNGGIQTISVLKSNDYAYQTNSVQSMATTINYSQLSRKDGYYIVRMYINRTDTGVKPAAFGYNFCSRIF